MNKSHYQQKEDAISRFKSCTRLQNSRHNIASLYLNQLIKQRTIRSFLRIAWIVPGWSHRCHRITHIRHHAAMIPGPYPITWRTHCKTSIHIHWGPALPIIVHGNTWIVVFSSIQSLFSLWPPGHTHFILIFFYAFTASSLLELLLIGLPLLQLFNAGVVELDSCIRVNIEFGVEVAWNFNQPIKYLQLFGLHPLFTVS